MEVDGSIETLGSATCISMTDAVCWATWSTLNTELMIPVMKFERYVALHLLSIISDNGTGTGHHRLHGRRGDSTGIPFSSSFTRYLILRSENAKGADSVASLSFQCYP